MKGFNFNLHILSKQYLQLRDSKSTITLLIDYNKPNIEAPSCYGLSSSLFKKNALFVLFDTDHF